MSFFKKAKLWLALVILACWEMRGWGIFGIPHILEKKLEPGDQCPCKPGWVFPCSSASWS